jgi:hypothetical protein
MPGTGGPRRRWWIAGAIVAAVVLVGAAGAVYFAVSSKASASVTLVPSSTPGPNPFTASVASEAPTATGSVVQKTEQLRKTLPVAKDTRTPVATGTTPGLYGGSGDAQVCDPQKLVSFLEAIPAKAAAWAGVLGIKVQKLASYVASLTPVILNSDTLVVNHGYRRGSATSFVSVLQAGTAVMVDATGTPRVKCNCGNPLTTPKLVSLASAPLAGKPWKGYASTNVIAVKPGPNGGDLTVVDLESGAVYTQPVGRVTALWAAASWSSSTDIGIVDQTDVWTSADGTTWAHVATVPHELFSGLAYANGHWVAVTLPPVFDTPQSDILNSTDLRTWKKSASVPGDLTAVAFGDGRWEAVGDAPPGSIGPQSQAGGAGIVYSSSNGFAWRLVATVADTSKYGLTGLTSVAYGDGRWIATAGTSIVPPVEVYASSDGDTWTPRPSDALEQQMGGAVSFGEGTWLITANSYSPPDPSTYAPAPSDGLADTSTDGSTWEITPANGLETTRVEAAAFGAGRWLVATAESDLPNPMHALVQSRIATSSDGKAWKMIGQIDGPMGAIAYGAVPEGGASTPNPTTTSPIPTTTAAAGTPDCSTASLQAARTTAGLDGRVSQQKCSGTWATAAVVLEQSEITGLFEWVGGAWAVRSRDTVCTQDVLPADLVDLACHSN